ncbi:MAG: hypothetical protein HYU56_05045 [Candidatus Aenigmarchaeota archaeon]|nr:hypothetical protein [Candidatus Aenigmarchaeota archaeon]
MKIGVSIRISVDLPSNEIGVTTLIPCNAENKSTPCVAASLSARPLLAVQQQPRVLEFTD